jgi:hypothetical protein
MEYIANTSMRRKNNTKMEASKFIDHNVELPPKKPQNSPTISNIETFSLCSPEILL